MDLRIDTGNVILYSCYVFFFHLGHCQTHKYTEFPIMIRSTCTRHIQVSLLFSVSAERTHNLDQAYSVSPNIE